jgi:hypothetical protein
VYSNSTSSTTTAATSSFCWYWATSRYDYTEKGQQQTRPRQNRAQRRDEFSHHIILYINECSSSVLTLVYFIRSRPSYALPGTKSIQVRSMCVVECAVLARVHVRENATSREPPIGTVHFRTGKNNQAENRPLLVIYKPAPIL